MKDRAQRLEGERRPSARYLVLIFLACVAVCAVFFSLGFVVGHNQQPAQASQMSPATENVAPPGNNNVPPTVNVPPGNPNAPPPNAGPTADESSVPATQHPKALQNSPAEAAEPLTLASPANSATRTRKKEPPAPSKTDTESPRRASEGSHFGVQVIASRTRADALTVVRMLKSRGYHVLLVSPSGSHEQNALYKVQVGPFTSRVQAEKASHRLKREGFRPFIVSR